LGSAVRSCYVSYSCSCGLTSEDLGFWLCAKVSFATGNGVVLCMN